MPELPEVETVCRTLRQLIEGRTIREVSVRLGRIVRRPDDAMLFAAMLAGQTFRGVERRAKFIRLLLDDYVLVSHLRMEGRYGLFAADEPVEKHTHVIFHFTDGTELRYKDVRQFGTMDLFATGEEFLHPPLNKLGIEPLSEAFTPAALRALLGSKSGKLKPLLLNQAYVVGIGNIYVDESLFRARLHPERTAASLNAAEWTRLHAAIAATLAEAVEAGGSSVKSYVNGQGEMGMFQQQLHVYGRKHEPCPVCGEAVVRFVVGGRGTHICPSCQPLKRTRARTKHA